MTDSLALAWLGVAAGSMSASWLIAWRREWLPVLLVVSTGLFLWLGIKN